VRVGAFCIDSTEVTSNQYAMFIASGPSAAGQPVACAWNTSYLPAKGWSFTADVGELPMSSVDWCDAYAYCAWAGKRLCGKIGGGPNPYDAVADPTQSEWFFACSRGGDGQHLYPYGLTFQPACAGGAGDAGDGGAENVRSRSACEGGFEGLFDMSGNVAEWEDSCDPDGGAVSDIDGSPAGSGDGCRTRGGSYADDALHLTCRDVGIAQTPRPRSRQTGRLGFRCCSE
jgi:formylglycine-generating enzyme